MRTAHLSMETHGEHRARQCSVPHATCLVSCASERFLILYQMGFPVGNHHDDLLPNHMASKDRKADQLLYVLT